MPDTLPIKNAPALMSRREHSPGARGQIKNAMGGAAASKPAFRRLVRSHGVEIGAPVEEIPPERDTSREPPGHKKCPSPRKGSGVDIVFVSMAFAVSHLIFIPWTPVHFFSPSLPSFCKIGASLAASPVRGTVPLLFFLVLL